MENYIGKIGIEAYCKASGNTYSDIARLTGSSRQRVWWWVNEAETWIFCESGGYLIDRIEVISRKRVYEREGG